MRTRFVCRQCGQEASKWLGRCPGCNEWNTFIEERVQPEGAKSGQSAVVPPVPVSEVVFSAVNRLQTGFQEFDRVLGGGIVPGSLVLIGGDPGIGKSTLVLQLGDLISRKYGPVLYVTGEESVEQVRMRAERLAALSPRLFLAAESDVETVGRFIQDLAPVMAVVDSIQTMFLPDWSSAPGSVGQVRESATRLMRWAKKLNVPVVLIGHVTKEGALAGPKVLEHMVDTVLYFEGERHNTFRILRAVKNRFGSTNEIGVFQMETTGLREVANPSEVFLAQRPVGAAGSVVVASMEGTRPVLLEVQALVSGNAFANPRRLVTGLDWNRALLMVAVLDNKLGMNLGGHDVYLNVAGGVRTDEPAVDLGLCMAVASSLRARPVDPHTVLIGEIGLTGEVRAVSQLEGRLNEADKMGFRRCVVPRRNGQSLSGPLNLDIVPVRSLAEAVGEVLGG